MQQMKAKFEKYIKWLDLNSDGKTDLKDLAVLTLYSLKAVLNKELIINKSIDIILEIINSESYKTVSLEDLNDLELNILKETVKNNGNKS